MSFDPNPTNNPYSASTQPIAPKKSNVLMYVLLGVGAVLVLGCCGCAGAMYWGGDAAMKAAMNVMGEQLKPSLQADPVVQEHVGDIQKLSMNFGASTVETQKAQKGGGQQRMVFDIEGSKGKGQVTGNVNQGSNPPRLSNGELKMSSGQSYPLTP